jgi:molybdopterin converting factor subunit 1
MRVTVRLFGQLRDLAGAAELECEVGDAARVRDVWQALVRDHAALASFGRALSSAVNLDYVRMDAPVSDGDEVAFLPPVSGGSDGAA